MRQVFVEGGCEKERRIYVDMLNVRELFECIFTSVFFFGKFLLINIVVVNLASNHVFVFLIIRMIFGNKI